MSDKSTAYARAESTAAAMAPFRLLDLPAELWSQICAFALATAYPSTLYLHEDMHARTLQALTRQPALLHTCKAIRAEGLPMLYADAIFLLMEANMHSPNWKLWLDSLAPDTRQYLTRVYITSTHQDVVMHTRKCGLLPEGTALQFAEPTGDDSLPLGDFTYRLTLPKADELYTVADTVPRRHGRDSKAEGSEGVRRESHPFRKLAMLNLWQARRGAPAKGRWL